MHSSPGREFIMIISKLNSHHLLSLALCGVFLVFAGGCAQHHAYLVPTPADNLANGGQSATASVDGISMTVTPNAWQGTPYDLYRRVTPLKVRIENHSNQPIRLTYGDFELETPQGTRRTAAFGDHRHTIHWRKCAAGEAAFC